MEVIGSKEDLSAYTVPPKNPYVFVSPEDLAACEAARAKILGSIIKQMFQGLRDKPSTDNPLGILIYINICLKLDKNNLHRIKATPGGI